jgi:ketosteroid isomerase-like protein
VIGPTTIPEGRTPVRDNKDHIRAFYAAMDAGDAERVRSYFDDDTTWTLRADGLPGAGTHRGWDAIQRNLLAPVRELFEPGQPTADIQRVIGDGPFVAVEFIARGNLRNERKYENHYAFVFEVRDDGKLRSVHEYLDTHYVSKVLFS